MSGRDKYKDIIDLPHFESKNRNHMSNLDRAAQFAPFAALVGYEESIDETGNALFYYAVRNNPTKYAYMYIEKQ